jgi:pSer/pThr/pTyr-binding forkhead associated (FHA) protein
MDEFVSRHHAEIIYESSKYYIRDCASSSGTFIKIIEKM